MSSDYAYVMEKCFNETSAPYIAIFEDDIVLADGWASKTIEALSTIREVTDPWLYLRLFFTESQLGWDKDVDVWYMNPIFQLIVPIAVSLAIAAGIKVRCWQEHRSAAHHISCSAFYVVLCVTVPAFIALLFISGYHSMAPESGIVKMNTKGCCAQALVYPREQVPALLHHIRTTKPYPQDLLIEDYANEAGLDRYAIAPQLVQHVGLISTRGMPKKYTQQTWASHFEDLDPEQMRREHAEVARWGIWRAEISEQP